MGCLLVKGKRIISIGYNKPSNGIRRHPWWLSVHAEEDALNNATNPNKTTAYVIVLTSAGNLVDSRPCSACWEKLKNARVKRVIYYKKNIGFTVEEIE